MEIRRHWMTRGWQLAKKKKDPVSKYKKIQEQRRQVLGLLAVKRFYSKIK